jgi:hypothetical protein
MANSSGIENHNRNKIRKPPNSNRTGKAKGQERDRERTRNQGYKNT